MKRYFEPSAKGNLTRYAAKKYRISSYWDTNYAEEKNRPRADENEELLNKLNQLQEENVTLKTETKSLKERNDALQQALVNALRKARKVIYEDVNGGRMFPCGIFITALQQNLLDAMGNLNEYVNSLIVIIFGKETLKKSVVKPTKEGQIALDPLKLKVLYDLVAEKSCYSEESAPVKINRIIQKKIWNLKNPTSKKNRKKLPITISERELFD